MFGSKKETGPTAAEEQAKRELKAAAVRNGEASESGMTKRERMALEIAKRIDSNDFDTFSEWADYAVNATDRLLERLQK